MDIFQGFVKMMRSGIPFPGLKGARSDAHGQTLPIG